MKAARVSERMPPEEGVKQYLALTNDGADLPLRAEAAHPAQAARSRSSPA